MQEMQEMGEKLIVCFDTRQEEFLSELKTYLEAAVDRIEKKEVPDEKISVIVQLEKDIYLYGTQISEAVKEKSATKEILLPLIESVDKYFSYVEKGFNIRN